MRTSHSVSCAFVVLSVGAVACVEPGEPRPADSIETVVSAATVPSGFLDEVFASGLTNPTAMEFAPDGRLFVTQQGGQLRVIKNGALLSTPFLTVPVNSSRRARPAGRDVRPELRHQQLRLRLLHRHDARHPQPRSAASPPTATSRCAAASYSSSTSTT